MLSEVAEFLINEPCGTYLDCTLGGGGHTSCLLEKYPDLNITALDCDAYAVKNAELLSSKYNKRFSFLQREFW